MQEKIQLEENFRMPSHIKKVVLQTLDNYRLVGDVTGLYIDGMLQTFIDFTNLMDTESNQNQFKVSDKQKNKD